MSAELVTEFVDKAVQMDSLEVEQFEGLVGAEFEETERNPEWIFYEYKTDQRLFTHGELRLATDSERALLSLWPGEEATLVEDDLDLDRWGEVEYLGINPRIPPEGTVSLTYLIEGIPVTFQIMYESRRLRCLVIEWGGQPK